MCAEVISVCCMICVCDTTDFIPLAFNKYHLVKLNI